MKKYLYIAIAAATLASCSQDDTLDVVQGQAIAFGNAFVNNSTRTAAIDPTYTGKTLDKFLVYGTVQGTGNAVNIYNGVEVSRPASLKDKELDASVEWTYNDQYVQYWIAGAAYNFAAVVNGTISEGVTTLSGNGIELDNTNMPKKITYTASSQSDLLYASQSVSSAAADQGLVKFDFEHLLSKVKFTAVNTTVDTDYTFKVDNIIITNSSATGDYYIQADETSVDAVKNANTWYTLTSGQTEFGDIEGVVYQTSATPYECATEKLLIPADYRTNNLNIIFDLIWSYKDEVIKTYNKSANVAIELKKGYAYNFKIETGMGNPIKFTVQSVPTWDTNIDNNDNTTNDDITLTL